MFLAEARLPPSISRVKTATRAIWPLAGRGFFHLAIFTRAVRVQVCPRTQTSILLKRGHRPAKKRDCFESVDLD